MQLSCEGDTERSQRYLRPRGGRTPVQQPCPTAYFWSMRGLSIRLLITLGVLACTRPPVSWSDSVRTGAPHEPPETVRGITGPNSYGCAGSIRIAKNGRTNFATWWRVRVDSSVVLVVSRASEGQQWSPPAIVDSTDHGVRGCGRPPAAIAADAASGYVHVAYYIEPSGGGGVFFAHSMDNGKTFHAPVPIVFGKNPSRTSVASSGDRVVVAYEDPNSLEPLIGLALSKTTGHIFEDRIIATSENGRARQPVIRVDKDSVRLWWSEYSPNPAVSATRPMYKAGKWN